MIMIPKSYIAPPLGGIWPIVSLISWYLVGLAAPALLPRNQEAGAGRDAARHPPAVALDEVLRLPPLQGIQDPRDDKCAPLQALWVPSWCILQPQHNFKELNLP